MGRDERHQFIEQIEKMRESKLICYILGDRPNFATSIADDAVRILFDHLENLGKQQTFDLFLYARGGNLMAPFRMVHLIREFCEKFNVIVPYRALSAATLLSLGADEILMGKMGELSPIDPTTGHPFNPQDPIKPGHRIPINVEDVTSFLTFAKEKANLSKEKDIDVFRILTSNIHPLALGNIERGYEVIRQLAPKLLEFHMKDKEKIKNIVESLTESKVHGYLITRHEAKKEIGLNIKNPSEELESLIWSLYSQYEKDMCLRELFNPSTILGNQASTNFSVEGAYLESTYATHAFVSEGIITRGRPARISPSISAPPSPPPTTPSEAPSTPPETPQEPPTAPSVRPTPTQPVPAIVTFTFRGWKKVS